MLVQELLREAIAKSLKKAQKKGDLPKFDLPESIPLEHPNQTTMGDYATPVCLQLARYARMAPIKIAEAVVARMPELDFVHPPEVAHPGFINFRLRTDWLQNQVSAIGEAGDSYGAVDMGKNRRVQVEFVSANPTGPLHVGSARNAVLGDALASVLEAAGYDVSREYYINDAGSRMQVFYETLYARYAQQFELDESVPEDGYHGTYMVDLAKEIIADEGRHYLNLPRDEAVAKIGAEGLRRVVVLARTDLEAMAVKYDCWFSEQSLYDNGQYDAIMTILRQRGLVYLDDGAVWFRASDLGADKDAVLVRSNGTPGYFASDVAYHYNKFVERGFEEVIDVWGADHQGHVPRMAAMMRGLELDPDRLVIILYQLVTLKRSGEVVRLSKRTGDMITLREVIDEVGADAVRYFLLSHSADSQMEFDLDLAKARSDENPVYYIQYAHARICSILRKAEDVDIAGADLGLLDAEAELALIRQMLMLPEVVTTAALHRAPHHLTYYAYDLASAFHSFYRDCRVVSSEPGDEEITRARLRLISTCKGVLSRVLSMMGMTAPETM